MALDNGVQATMPVAPAGYGYGGGGFGGGFGNDGAWIIIFLLALMGGWGGNWGGSNGTSDLALLAAMNQGSGTLPGYSQSNDFSNLERENDIIRSDICSNFANVNQTLANGFQGVQTSFAQAELSRANTQAALMQQLYNSSLADVQARCETNANITNGFAQTNYNLASQGCDTRNTIQNSTRDVLDKLSQMEFNTIQRENDNLRSEVQGLRFQISQGAQNAYLTQVLRPYPQPAFIVGAPNVPVESTGGTTTTG